MRELFEAILGQCDAGQDAMLVCVTNSHGSTPRGAGTCMLVGQTGRVWGTVGGGEAEYRSTQRAQDLLRRGENGTGSFAQTALAASDDGARCTGSIDAVFCLAKADDATHALCEEAIAAIDARKPAWLVLDPDADEPLALVPAPEGANAAGVIVSGNAFALELWRPGRVFVFGAGHVSRALVQVLSFVGFDCAVLDSRAALLEESAFPEASELVHVDLDALNVPVTAADYIVAMTASHLTDYAVQRFALTTPARYIGMIGSGKKIAFITDKLRGDGYGEADIARIHAPIGLMIGATTPEELAISIAAQLIQERSKEPKTS